MAEESIRVIQGLATKLNRSPGSPTSAPPVVLGQITSECLERLEEPQHKQAKPAARILYAIAKAADSNLQAIIPAVLPKLLSMYTEANSIDKRRAIMEPIQLLLESAICVQDLQLNGLALKVGRFFDPYKDELFMLFSQGAMAVSNEEAHFRVLALECLIKLCMIGGTMQSNEVGLVVQYLDEIVIDDARDFKSELNQAAIRGLQNISKLRLEVITATTIPKLLAKLPSTSMVADGSYLRALDVLASLGAEPRLSDVLIRRLFGLLDTATRSESSSQYCNALLSTLYFIFKQSDSGMASEITKYRERILELLQFAARLCLSHSQHPLVNESSLDRLGLLVSFAIRDADDTFQSDVAQQVYKLYTDSHIFTYWEGVGNISVPRRLTVILSTYLLASLRPKVSQNEFELGSR